MDGVQFDGGTAEDYPLTLGSNSFIDGFEAGLVGVMPGQTVSLDLFFPNPYPNNPDLAGQPVVFEVTVNYIEETVYPEYNDQFVSDISEGKYTTTAEYSVYIKETLEADLAADMKESKQTVLLDMVLDATTVMGYPQEEYDAYYDEFVAYYTDYASYFGMTLEDFMLAAYNNTLDEFYSVAQEYAYETVVSNLIIAAISQAEDLSVSDEEYAAEIAVILSSDSGFTSEEELVEYYGKDYLNWYMLQKKVMQFIDDNSIEK
jgi:trigger factor